MAYESSPEEQDMGMESPAPMEEQSEMGQQGGGNVLHVSPDMLPKGMTLNEGDIVEFKVIGPADADGDWPIIYRTDGDGESDSWEDGLRKHMSPRNSEQEAQ